VWEEFAPAKINLFLRVTGRRGDGYHLLDSLTIFAGVGDTLRARDAAGLSLDVTGPFAAGLASEADNLVLRAARELAAAADVPARARLSLEKNLPIASGIGGGSSDAAAALRLLGRLWGPSAEAAITPPLVARLGADVPVCLAARPARMRGIGERLDPAPALPEFGIVLVNPGAALATAEVFRARDAAFSAEAVLPEGWADAASMAADLAALGNDLEPPAVRLRPVIAEVLAAISSDPACLLARMSGSGATCFCLCQDPAAAVAAAARLARPGWWSWGGGVHRQPAGV
jgi:4-diphosphocytidyl-2-C-methyl-D-erythritol kinase